MFFKNKKGIYTAHRLKLKRKCRKQVNLLMIVDGKILRTIKNRSRSLSKMNRKKPLLLGLIEWLLDSITSKPKCFGHRDVLDPVKVEEHV